MPVAEQHDPDLPLFKALREGDSGSLAQIMNRHERWVRGVVFGVLGRTGPLDDVMQEVWLAVWRRAKTLQKLEKWRFWLYAIARNAAVDAGRKLTRQRALWTRLTSFAARSPRHEDEAHRRLADQEQHQRVLSAIHGLPEIYREPFVLRHLEAWSYRQIAQTMGLPVDTVETRLVRARRLLREVLAAK